VGRKPTPKERKNPKEKVWIDMKWTSRGDRGSQKKANRSLPRTKCDLVVAISTRHALNGGPIWKRCLFPRAGRLCRPAHKRPARPGCCCFLPRADRASKRALARACLLGPWRLGSCYKVLEKSKKKRARHCSNRRFLFVARILGPPSRRSLSSVAAVAWDRGLRLPADFSGSNSPSTQACHVDFFGSNPSSLSLSLSISLSLHVFLLHLLTVSL